MKQNKNLNRLMVTGLITGLCIVNPATIFGATVIKQNVTADNAYSDLYEYETTDSYEGYQTESTVPITLDGATPDEVVIVQPDSPLDNVIYNYDGVTVTLTGCNESQGSLYFQVTMENNTSEYVYMSITDASLNGYQASSSYISAYENSKSDDWFSIGFDSNNKRYLDLNNITNMEFSLAVQNYNDYYSEATKITKPIKFKINSTLSRKSNVSGGTLLYNENGLKITKKDSFIRNYGSADAHIVLQLENNTDQSIHVSNTTAVINGYAISPSFSCTIEPGKKTIEHLVLSESKLEELNISKISDIKELRANFSVVDSEYYYNYYGDQGLTFETPLINLLK